MLKQLLEQFILKEDIYYHYNIVPGHSKFKVNWKFSFITAAFKQVINKPIEYYFFCFQRDGMYLYQYKNFKFFGDIIFIDWQEVSNFKIKQGLLEIEISFVFKDEKFNMMLSKFVHHESWIKENIKYLLDNQFFYISK